MSSTPLLLLLLAQFPQTVPPLASPALVAPASPQLPIAVTGRPALAWRGSEWIIVWKDVRRATSPLGPANVYFTPWDGGAQAEFPGGVPLGGPPSQNATDELLVATNQRDTLIAYAVFAPDGRALVARATDGGSTFGPPFVLSQPNSTIALPTLAGSSSNVLAAWYAGTAVQLYLWPSGARAALDAGANINSLSVGEADGGFLVSWLGSGPGSIITLVNATTLAPLRTDTLSTSGIARVQVVGTPRARIVITSSLPAPSSAMTHTFNGLGWIQMSTVPGTLGPDAVHASATSTGLVTSYATSTGRFVTASQLQQLSVSSGQTVLAPLSLKNAAMANDGTSAVLLATGSNEVFAQRVLANVATPMPVVTPEAPVSLLRAPATQRSPSAVWFDPLSQFLVAWDEERADGGYALMTSFLSTAGELTPPVQLPGLTNSQLGYRPTLLRRPDGSAHGVQLNLGTSARSVYQLAFDGGLSLGAALTTARSITHGIMGNQTVLQWGPSGSNVSAWADTETLSRFDTPGRSPSCAAWVGGEFFLPIAIDGGMVFASVDDGPAVTTVQTDRSVQAPSAAVCAAASATPQELLLTWLTNPGFVVGRASLVAGPIITNITGSSSDNVSVGPFAAPVRSGDLVVWITEGPAAVNAQIDTRAGLLGPVVLGRAEPATLSVASSPAGVGLVLWETFDADAGARRVELRLLDVAADGGFGSADAGTMDAGQAVDAGARDAGQGPDGGASDAGSPDGGASADAGPAPDAGAPADGGDGADGGGQVDAGPGPTEDAGASDAGPSLDGGAPDGGVTFIFVPAACGCGASPGGWLFLGALGLLGLARRRTRGTRSAR